MISQITVDLQQREDRDKGRYFVGWLSTRDIPVESLSVEKGLTFIIFPGTSDTVPQLVIRTKMSDEERDERKRRRDRRDGRDGSHEEPEDGQD